MKIKRVLSALLLCATALSATAQNKPAKDGEPLYQGKGRIAISSDGNEHDHDDWAATPVALAILASQGLQDKLALYTYSDHIWGSNQTHLERGFKSYDEMRESALVGAEMFGFDKSKFICAVDDAEVAYEAMKEQINMSSAENPLFIIAAGPMQVVGEAINRADVSKRKYVTLITHSTWNNSHADKPKKYKWDKHSGWTYAEMKEAFESEEGGSCNFLYIANQNHGRDYKALKTKREEFDWVKTSPARSKYKKGSWDWLYTRLEAGSKDDGKTFDASDAGMTLFLVSGVQKSSPDIVRQLLENPKKK